MACVRYNIALLARADAHPLVFSMGSSLSFGRQASPWSNLFPALTKGLLDFVFFLGTQPLAGDAHGEHFVEPGVLSLSQHESITHADPNPSITGSTNSNPSEAYASVRHLCSFLSPWTQCAEKLTHYAVPIFHVFIILRHDSRFESTAKHVNCTSTSSS